MVRLGLAVKTAEADARLHLDATAEGLEPDFIERGPERSGVGRALGKSRFRPLGHHVSCRRWADLEPTGLPRQPRFAAAFKKYSIEPVTW